MPTIRTTTLNEQSRFLAEYPEWHCRECGAVWEGYEEPSDGGFTCDACQEDEEPAEVCRARWEYLNGGMEGVYLNPAVTDYAEHPQRCVEGALKEFAL